MYKLKHSDDGYLTRLAGFLKAAEGNRVEKGESYIWCPCVDCKNGQKSVYVKVEEHLIFRGFMPDYICWSRHGEMMVGRTEIHLDFNGDNDDLNNENCDNLSGMLHDCEYDFANEDYDKFQELFDESEKPLYDGCTKYTKLSANEIKADDIGFPAKGGHRRRARASKNFVLNSGTERWISHYEGDRPRGRGAVEVYSGEGNHKRLSHTAGMVYKSVLKARFLSLRDQGFPIWLKYVPGMAFRTDNGPFKNAMERFTLRIVNMMKSEELFEPQGGPIIMSQIENEYGPIEWDIGAPGKAYSKWATQMADGLKTGVPWIMCKQEDAQLMHMIDTCNGFYCEKFTPNKPYKPKMLPSFGLAGSLNLVVRFLPDLWRISRIRFCDSFRIMVLLLTITWEAIWVVKLVNVPVVQHPEGNEAVVKPVLKTVVKSVTKADVKPCGSNAIENSNKRKITYISNGTLAKRTRNSTLNKLK
ncbi:hypothetical protein LXL04_007867 [Taraxacum kok-saghyz]